MGKEFGEKITIFIKGKMAQVVCRDHDRLLRRLHLTLNEDRNCDTVDKSAVKDMALIFTPAS